MAKNEYYRTTYKKGNLLNELCFKHDGDLSSAVSEVKDYCDRHNYRHIHTVPMFISLRDSAYYEPGNNEELIDIEKDDPPTPDTKDKKN